MRLILFDVDGTLIDSQVLITRAMAAAFTAEGREAPSAAETLSIVGLSLPVAIKTLCPAATAPEVAALVEAYKAHFVDIRRETGGEAAAPLYPGMRDVLERLAAEEETFLGVATGKARRGLDHFFEAHDLHGLFATLQTADLHPSKPHPAMINAALSEIGVTAAQAVMIGDTSFDMEMARAAGVRGLGVSWGYHPVERLHAAGADMIVDDADALMAALAEPAL